MNKTNIKVSKCRKEVVPSGQKGEADLALLFRLAPPPLLSGVTVATEAICLASHISVAAAAAAITAEAVVGPASKLSQHFKRVNIVIQIGFEGLGHTC